METKLLKLELTEETHRKFKVATAMNGQSMQSALVELVHYYIDNPMNKKDDEKK